MIGLLRPVHHQHILIVTLGRGDDSAGLRAVVELPVGRTFRGAQRDVVGVRILLMKDVVGEFNVAGGAVAAETRSAAALNPDIDLIQIDDLVAG